MARIVLKPPWRASKKNKKMKKSDFEAEKGLKTVVWTALRLVTDHVLSLQPLHYRHHYLIHGTASTGQVYHSVYSGYITG
jgi:hypothetical protein